ncbi:MAG: hypothetical protein R3E54_16880 [Halioglobus sp.]
MEELLACLALMLPTALGCAWVTVLVPRDTPGRLPLAWGSGTLLGILSVPLLLRFTHVLGQPLSFTVTASLVALLCLPALWMLWRRAAPAPGVIQTPENVLGNGEKLLCALLAALIALRLGTLGLELLWRPLYPWDATMHWATKARVWFEYRSIVPFVPHAQWLALGGEGVFTDRHPFYPSTIPLLQVWMSLAIGKWDESLINLPWLLCLPGLGAAFYGQLRLAGAGVVTATVFSYLLLSMPLINTHVALAGYADLFLGATYCCALMSLHNWITRREAWLAALTLLFTLSCLVIKNEGFFWALSLAPALAVAFMQRREAAKLVFLLGLVGVLLLLVLPREMQVAGHTLQQLAPAFNPAALSGLIKSIWLHDSWHLFGYLALMLLPLGLLLPGALTRQYLGLTAALASAVGAFLFLFLFTGFGWGAATLTAVGRLSVQLAPGIVFLCALLFEELLRRGRLLSPPSTRL